MTCPSRVKAGKVDQSGAMLSEDVEEKGYALLCCAVPVGEGVIIETVTEDELLEEQLCA
jgi:ferredoxin